MGGLVKTYGFPQVFYDFGLFCGGLEGSRRAILVPMLGDVGCKMGPRWVQEGLESDFFGQLGVLMGILAPRWQDKASQNGFRVVQGREIWSDLGPPASEAWSSKGAGSKDPRVGR